MVATENEAQERRRFPRYATNQVVSVRSTDVEALLAGNLSDLSYEGCQLNMDHPVRAELNDALELRLQTGAASCCVTGLVRHLSPDGRAAGLQFLPPTGPDAAELTQMLSDLRLSVQRSSPRGLDS